MQKITPFLWFDGKAEEAARYYASIFKRSEIKAVTHYGEAGPLPKGTVMTVAFQLDGNDFVALNGGPEFKFNPAVSFVIDCKDQAEVDHFWNKLREGGSEQQCGWVTDKFGITWQVVPSDLTQYIGGKDPKKALAATKAMFQMKKLDIAKLKEAYERG